MKKGNAGVVLHLETILSNTDFVVISSKGNPNEFKVVRKTAKSTKNPMFSEKEMLTLGNTIVNSPRTSKTAAPYKWQEDCEDEVMTYSGEDSAAIYLEVAGKKGSVFLININAKTGLVGIEKVTY